MKGDAAKGVAIFGNICGKCHVVNGKGTDLGPNLSEVGNKYGKDGLYENILYPSAGISFGFENNLITLKNGTEGDGVVIAETAEELTLKNAGAVVTKYKKSEIAERHLSKISIMPEGLQAQMPTQDLVNLVEYLSTLKKAQAPAPK